MLFTSIVYPILVIHFSDPLQSVTSSSVGFKECLQISVASNCMRLAERSTHATQLAGQLMRFVSGLVGGEHLGDVVVDDHGDDLDVAGRCRGRVR